MEHAKNGCLSKVHFMHLNVSEQRMRCKNFVCYSEREHVWKWKRGKKVRWVSDRKTQYQSVNISSSVAS